MKLEQHPEPCVLIHRFSQTTYRILFDCLDAVGNRVSNESLYACMYISYVRKDTGYPLGIRYIHAARLASRISTAINSFSRVSNLLGITTLVAGLAAPIERDLGVILVRTLNTSVRSRANNHQRSYRRSRLNTWTRGLKRWIFLARESIYLHHRPWLLLRWYYQSGQRTYRLNMFVIYFIPLEIWVILKRWILLGSRNDFLTSSIWCHWR